MVTLISNNHIKNYKPFSYLLEIIFFPFLSHYFEVLQNFYIIQLFTWNISYHNITFDYSAGLNLLNKEHNCSKNSCHAEIVILTMLLWIYSTKRRVSSDGRIRGCETIDASSQTRWVQLSLKIIEVKSGKLIKVAFY
jgi:hypothetical protein